MSNRKDSRPHAVTRHDSEYRVGLCSPFVYGVEALPLRRKGFVFTLYAVNMKTASNLPDVGTLILRQEELVALLYAKGLVPGVNLR